MVVIVLQLLLAALVSVCGAPRAVACPAYWYVATVRPVTCAWSREDGTERLELEVPIGCPYGARPVARGNRVVCVVLCDGAGGDRPCPL